MRGEDSGTIYTIACENTLFFKLKNDTFLSSSTSNGNIQPTSKP